MKTFKFILRNSRRAVILSVLGGLLSGLSNAGLLAIINEALAFEKPWEQHQLALIFLALCLAVPITRVVSQYLLNRLAEVATFELRVQLVSQILAAPLRLIEGVGSSRLVAAFNNDIGAIITGLGFLPTLVANLAVIVGALAYLGWLSWPLLIVTVVLMSLGTATFQIPMGGAVRRLRQAREEYDNLYEHFSSLTEGLKELKLHRDRRESFREQFAVTGRILQDLNIVARTLFGAAGSWGQLFIFVVIGVILFIVSGLIPISAGTLSGYCIIVLFIRGSLQVIMERVPDLSAANIAISKLQSLGLSLEKEATEIEAPTGAVDPGWRSLELVQVRHSYRTDGQEDEFILGPIDLAFTPGELVFVVGGNGSGKTSMIKILLGLYAPEGGEVRFDGETVTDANRDRYRQRFSAVFSDFHLFESLLGLDAPDLDARAKGYLSQLQLERKIRVEGGKLSSVDLSQGQRKRLALLTAYLENRPIYVFDEWAADQDPHFKEVFYLELLPELKARGKTVIVISHDDRYYHVADRIIKLEYGQVQLDQRRLGEGSFRETLTLVAGTTVS